MFDMYNDILLTSPSLINTSSNSVVESVNPNELFTTSSRYAVADDEIVLIDNRDITGTGESTSLRKFRFVSLKAL